MFSGAQFSLYPMSDDFAGVILGAVATLDPYRKACRIETDDVSTLIVGPPEQLFPAMRDLLVSASETGQHCALSATVSRGCPGEPDDPLCEPLSDTGFDRPLADRVAEAAELVRSAQPTYQPVAAQFSFYPLGRERHMDEIGACIEFLKNSGVYDRPKHFCTKLKGDAGNVFAALGAAFVRFGSPGGHVVLDVTVSANSPSSS